MTVDAISWHGDRLSLLDQRRLPDHIERLDYRNASDTASAITDMVVRGAPAIGITAAYAVVLAYDAWLASPDANGRAQFETDLETLGQARPTAVNLGWSISRMRSVLGARDAPDPEMRDRLAREAVAIHEEDVAANRRMGELGTALIEGGPCTVMTHCNAGALATGGIGTALGVVRAGFSAGRIAHVLAGETRPWLQGARLTAFELVEEGIPVSLVADGAASYAMAAQDVRWVIVGADRVVANGDVANKIGTYSLAVSARHHGVKFMVVAPTSTIDMTIAEGASIPIEERAGDELIKVGDRQVAPSAASVWNPVFDVTPATLVDALVTERGVIEQPNREKLAELMRDLA
ncbi:MAG: S-methyl-5-thioribose-1-phosphate isomerase [Pseudomonadota bacterium]